MTTLTLDQALPAIQDLAKRKANAFVRRCGIATHDREDIASELVLRFITRWPQYDSNLASVRTFSSRIMDNELVSILRYRLAGRRRHIACGASVHNDDDADSRLAALSTTPRTLADQHHFWLDIERALVPLPEPLLETARGLCWYNPSELSLVLGRSRPVIYERIQRLRKVLLAAGIGPDYLTTSGNTRLSPLQQSPFHSGNVPEARS